VLPTLVLGCSPPLSRASRFGLLPGSARPIPRAVRDFPGGRPSALHAAERRPIQAVETQGRFEPSFAPLRLPPHRNGAAHRQIACVVGCVPSTVIRLPARLGRDSLLLHVLALHHLGATVMTPSSIMRRPSKALRTRPSPSPPPSASDRGSAMPSTCARTNEPGGRQPGRRRIVFRGPCAAPRGVYEGSGRGPVGRAGSYLRFRARGGRSTGGSGKHRRSARTHGTRSGPTGLSRTRNTGRLPGSRVRGLGSCPRLQ
jgi:hypothetical protein